MNSYRRRGLWVIWLCFIAALILQMVPWPDQIYMFRPSWLVLVLIYWVMALPHRVNVGTAFILGLLWDLTLGTTLGVHSISLSMVAYLVAFKSQLLRNMALWQQALIVSLLTILLDLVSFVLVFILYHVDFHAEMFWSGLVNAILWPWLFLLMRKIRRQFGVQ